MRGGTHSCHVEPPAQKCCDASQPVQDAANERESNPFSLGPDDPRGEQIQRTNEDGPQERLPAAVFSIPQDPAAPTPKLWSPRKAGASGIRSRDWASPCAAINRFADRRRRRDLQQCF